MRSLRRLSQLSIVAVVLTGAVFVTACGSSDKSGSSATAAKSGSATTAEKVKVPTATIGWVEATLTSAIEQRFHNVTKAALAHIGWKLVTIDTGGDPAKAASGVNSLVSSGVQGIILDGITPQTARAGLIRAQAKKIPVAIVGTAVDASVSDKMGIPYYAESEKELTAPLEQMIVKDLKPGAKVGVLTTDFLLSGKGRSDELVPFLKSKGLNVVGVAQTGFAFNDGLKKASGLLTAHPDLQALIPVYDLWTAASVAAVKKAGLVGKVKVYSYYADAINNPLMRKNPKTVVGLADGNVIYSPLVAVTQLLRSIADKQPMDPKAADGLFEFDVITPETLPPGNQSGPISQDEALQKYIPEWDAKYQLPTGS